MEQISFYNSFNFYIHHLTSYRHTDNTCGIPCHYIARMIRGSARIVSTSGEELLLKVGDVFYLPMGLRYHSYWSLDEGGEVAWESYAFKILPTSQKVRYAMQIIDADEDGIAVLDSLSENLKVSPTSVGLLYLFIGRVIDKMRTDSVDARAQLWDRAVSYITAHPDLQVRELATYCNMSESGIYAFFKNYGQTTPIELKNRILIKRATDLLMTTDLSVEEICSRIGFCNAAYFRKQLRRVTGKTPHEIRRESERI